MPKPTVIDLSHYQVIPESLHEAATSGIQAVIHKATESTSAVDKKAKARLALTRDAGLLWGVYHFMRPGSVKAQVEHFLAQPVIDDDTLLVLDFEVNGITLHEALEFLKRVEDRTGQSPVLYSGNTLKELGGATHLPELADYRLWLAQYGPRAVLPKGYDSWWLWQYSEKGKVPGIDGPVDVNAYNGTALNHDWVIKTSTTASPATSTPAKNSIENSEDSTLPDREQSSNDQATETKLTKESGGTTVEVTGKNEQDVNKPALVSTPEPYMGVGFWAVIKRDIAALGVGNFSLQGISEYLNQVQGWPPWVVAIVAKFATLALLFTIGWFVFRVVHYAIDSWKKHQITKIEADAATSTVRKDVEWK